MRKVKEILKKTFLYDLKWWIKNRKALFNDLFYWSRLHLKYNGSVAMKKDQIKLENRIRIGIHGIEKGFSFRKVRLGFGEEKIKILCGNIQEYIKRYGEDEFVLESISTLKYYLEKNTEAKNVGSIERLFFQLVDGLKTKVFESQKATIEIKKSDVDNVLSAIDFESFLSTRHSYRYFSPDSIDKKTLNEAFRLAEYTPTACNRQAQKVFVFEGKEKEEVANWQVGCKGFIEEFQYLLLITVDQRAYFQSEINQMYVDGGLYAMNLLHCLHAVGVATIPLTAGSFSGKKRELLKKYAINQYDTPIMFIAIGSRPETANVNLSKRKAFENYVMWK